MIPLSSVLGVLGPLDQKPPMGLALENIIARRGPAVPNIIAIVSTRAEGEILEQNEANTSQLPVFSKIFLPTSRQSVKNRQDECSLPSDNKRHLTSLPLQDGLVKVPASHKLA